jgi:uncharacterized protein
MKAYLLDVNVLVALALPSHVLHSRVVPWFEQHSERGWATCPFTEAAFVRILSNPALSPGALAPERALELLQRNVEHVRHQFWPADITLSHAFKISVVRATGHRQISDIYLLGLAIQHKGLLATCDEGIPAWGSPSRSDRQFVEVIH